MAKINPSTAPSDWARRISNSQPEHWKGSKIGVYQSIPLSQRIADALRTLEKNLRSMYGRTDR